MESITKKDLEKLKEEMTQQLISNATRQEKWVKTNRAREILGCSRGKIQSLRDKGILKYNKVGGTYYYYIDSVLRMTQDEPV